MRDKTKSAEDNSTSAGFVKHHRLCFNRDNNRIVRYWIHPHRSSRYILGLHHQHTDDILTGSRTNHRCRSRNFENNNYHNLRMVRPFQSHTSVHHRNSSHPHRSICTNSHYDLNKFHFHLWLHYMLIGLCIHRCKY